MCPVALRVGLLGLALVLAGACKADVEVAGPGSHATSPRPRVPEGVAPPPRSASSTQPPPRASGSDAVAPSTSGARRTLRYLALGDSFTIGTGSSEADAFPAVFARTSGCDVTLLNVARNGYTTDDVIARELPALESFRPDFVTVGIGANDRVRGRPIADYRKNVGRILDAVVASGVSPDAIVLVPQPDWSRSPAARDFGTPEALDRSIREMNAVLREEGQKRGARWLPLEERMREQAARGELAPDQLHPSRGAHAAWAAELVRTICPAE